MSPEPAHCHRLPSGSKPAQTPGGGNLARAHFTRAGLFSSSTQQAQQLKADLTDVNEAGFSSLPARGTGAAINRLHAPAAKSRPLPLSFQAFVEVDHISHCLLLSDLKPIRTSFRDGGIFIREGR